MVVCSNCQSKQLDGVIFCLECGASLVDVYGNSSTRTLSQGVRTEPEPAVHAAREPSRMSLTVTLLVLASGRRLVCELIDELLIGREDTARGILPDIDLGPEGGHDAGVSRRHAILAYRDGIWTAEDLGSANGTYVNGKRLAAQAPVRVSSGDELTCGTLRMRVEIG